MKVEELMTRDVLTVAPDTPLKEVAGLMVTRGISGLPVEYDGHVLGVVSETDILHKECGRDRDGGLLAHLLHRGHSAVREKLEARTAGEAMTSPAVMIRPTTAADTAAALMIERGIDRLVVVDDRRLSGDVADDGRLVGIVTRGDFVRAFARADAEIQREVTDVLCREFVLSPRDVHATVEQGEVTLAGEVDYKDTAESLTAAVRRVPGVVSLVSELTWSLDKPVVDSNREEIHAGTGGRSRWPY